VKRGIREKFRIEKFGVPGGSGVLGGVGMEMRERKKNFMRILWGKKLWGVLILEKRGYDCKKGGNKSGGII